MYERNTGLEHCNKQKNNYGLIQKDEYRNKNKKISKKEKHQKKNELYIFMNKAQYVLEKSKQTAFENDEALSKLSSRLNFK